MKFAADFAAFLTSEVNLNKSRLDRLEDSVQALETYISKHTTFQDSFLEMIPAGSWAQRVIIRPVRDNDGFDADILLSLKEQPSWQANDYIENLWSAFRDDGTYKGLAQRKTRCVRIDYAGEFHIDVVPYLQHSGVYCITNRTTAKFERSNPEAFTAWVDERQRITNGYFIKVVRLLKYLRDYKDTFSCKSIILMTLLGNRVTEIDTLLKPGAYSDVPSTLVTLMKSLADWLPEVMPAVYDPAGTGDNFSERYKEKWHYENFRTCIIGYADTIQRAYAEQDRETSISLWRKVFGDNFKSETTSQKASSTTMLFPATTRAKDEQDISETPFNFPVQLDERYRVRIAARVTGLKTGDKLIRNGFRQYTLAEHGNRVSKNRSLTFTAKPSGPTPFLLYWKVRNGGQEAAQVDQLRGEITLDEGKMQKQETTAYIGTHYVECYVVKDGKVVAKDRQQVIVAKAGF